MDTKKEIKQKNKNLLFHIIYSIKYSIEGLKATFKSETAFRFECILCLILLPVIFFLNIHTTNKLLLTLSLFLILLAELVNTAIEVVINRISEEIHPLSKKAKDIGSSMVFIAFIHAIFIWFMILLD